MNHPSHLTTYDCDYCTGEMGWCDTCARVTYLDECEHEIEVPNEPQDELPLRFWGGAGE